MVSVFNLKKLPEIISLGYTNVRKTTLNNSNTHWKLIIQHLHRLFIKFDANRDNEEPVTFSVKLMLLIDRL